VFLFPGNCSDIPVDMIVSSLVTTTHALHHTFMRTGQITTMGISATVNW
jgi:hypothetical protein